MSEKHITLWINGYNYQLGLSVQVVQESEKAMKFEVKGDSKDYTFWMPKSALKEDKNVKGIFNIAKWFSFNDFQRWVFNTFGSAYAR